MGSGNSLREVPDIVKMVSMGDDLWETILNVLRLSQLAKIFLPNIPVPIVFPFSHLPFQMVGSYRTGRTTGNLWNDSLSTNDNR